MIDYLKNISMYLILGIAVQAIAVWLKSDYLTDFLIENLITLLIALLAINTTTISVIMTKLREIYEKNKVDFSRSINSMKKSIIAQVILIFAAIIVLVLLTSQIILSSYPNASFILNVLMFGIFFNALHIQFDTANGVFVILRHENNS